MSLASLDPLSLPSISLQDKAKLPSCAAIYFVIDGSTVLYIGRTANLKQRWLTHHCFQQLVKATNSAVIAWLEIRNLATLNESEESLIKRFNPSLNGTEAAASTKKPKRTSYVSEMVFGATNREATKERRSRSQMVALLIEEALKARGYEFPIDFKEDET
ncbi:GIY-YIG nuclease family protein [Phormidesmis priestleyi]